METNQDLNSLNFEKTEPVVNPVSSNINRVGVSKFPLQKTKTPFGKNYVWGFFGILIAILVIGGFLFTILNKSGAKVLSPFDDGPNGPSAGSDKTVSHPLTGVMYTEEESKDWNGKRPIGVMINNHIDARPQWGISQADIVYEMVAEGGITRYLAFFLTDMPEKLGPIRSIREYYLVLVKELGDAAIMHIGWSPQALVAIESWPVRSLARGGATFDRDQPRLDQGIATEHTAYSGGPYLRELAESLGWEGVSEFNIWKFKDDSPVNQADEAAVKSNQITVDFWYKGDYSAIFKYNQSNNSYQKFTGYDGSDLPLPVLDANNTSQVEVKNVIIQFVPELSIEGDDKGRLDYELIGSGEGIVFFDGTYQKITWNKSERDIRTVYYDLNGNEVQFNRGRFWISIVPDRNMEQVVY